MKRAPVLYLGGKIRGPLPWTDSDQQAPPKASPHVPVPSLLLSLLNFQLQPRQLTTVPTPASLHTLVTSTWWPISLFLSRLTCH